MLALILTSISSEQSGGILTQQNILIEILKNNGFKVEIYVLNDGKNSFIDFYLPTKPKGLNFAKDYDIVILNDPHIGRLTWYTILNKKFKIILFSHGWIFHDSRSFSRKLIFRILSKVSLSSIDRIFCVSPQDLIAIDGNDMPNASLLWNPVKRIYDGPLESLTFNGEFVYIGPNNKNKNLKKLILLFNQDTMQTFRLNIIGRGTKELNPITKNIRIFGEISDLEIDEILKKSSYYISLSKYEGFGISIVEAMSYGLTPILSDNIAHKYHITTSKCGLLLSNDIKEANSQIIDFCSIEKTKLNKSLMDYSKCFTTDVFTKKLKSELNNRNGSREI
ncbi:glycosyltransferase [Flavobacterium sp. Arc2]|jgi:glycosyltransferase involved in cell wall biosynthesis|uniref:glycosyltransferase n=1 Tax=Flavobacterium sp. Arc2 TaxID=3046685 RepID=UPI00352BE2B3